MAEAPYSYEAVFEGHIIFKEPVPENLREEMKQEYLEAYDGQLTWLNDRHLVCEFILIPASDFTDEENDCNTFTELLYHLDQYTGLPEYFHDVDLTPSSDRHDWQPSDPLDNQDDLGHTFDLFDEDDIPPFEEDDEV